MVNVFNNHKFYYRLVFPDDKSIVKVVFLALDAINVEYIPSIKNIKSAAEDLYSYEEIDCYQGLIKPTTQIKN